MTCRRREVPFDGWWLSWGKDAWMELEVWLGLWWWWWGWWSRSTDDEGGAGEDYLSIFVNTKPRPQRYSMSNSVHAHWDSHTTLLCWIQLFALHDASWRGKQYRDIPPSWPRKFISWRSLRALLDVRNGQGTRTWYTKTDDWLDAIIEWYPLILPAHGLDSRNEEACELKESCSCPAGFPSLGCFPREPYTVVTLGKRLGISSLEDDGILNRSRSERAQSTTATVLPILCSLWRTLSVGGHELELPVQHECVLRMGYPKVLVVVLWGWRCYRGIDWML